MQVLPLEYGQRRLRRPQVTPNAGQNDGQLYPGGGIEPHRSQCLGEPQGLLRTTQSALGVHEQRHQVGLPTHAVRGPQLRQRLAPLTGSVRRNAYGLAHDSDASGMAPGGLRMGQGLSGVLVE